MKVDRRHKESFKGVAFRAKNGQEKVITENGVQQIESDGSMQFNSRALDMGI